MSRGISRTHTALLLVGAIAALFAVVLGACAGAPASAARPVMVILADVSGSTDSAAVRARYLRDFVTVATYAAAREGLLFADLIDDNPLAHAELPITADFSLPDRVRGNRLYESAAREKMIKTATAQASRLLRRKPARGTDIFGALVLAERIFARKATAGDKYLVVFSDMFNSTPDANLYTQPLGRDDIATLIAKLRRSGRLADLSGVRAYITGAGVQGGRAASADRILAVQRFWTSYLQAAGATLPPGAYTGRLLIFP